MSFITRLKAKERMSDLCIEFGISRKTGYKLLERFERLGPAGLFDVSRRPHHLARQSPAELKELFLEARKAHSTWGPKKLLYVVGKQNSGVAMPAPSTVADWLRAAGFSRCRRRVVRTSPYSDSLYQAVQPNDVWCVDFKGQGRLRTGKYVYPLTITDNFSRYLFACEGFEGIDGREVRGVFEQLFETHGLPKLIRSDNGSPFASRGLFGLTRLSAWWMKVGVTPERITPAHPEENGRHERMHRTLKEETMRPMAATLLAQQERFDDFVLKFNEERPHEALGMKPPALVHVTSPRKANKAELDYPLHDDVITVGKNGHVNVLRRRGGIVFISAALAGERIGIRELDGNRMLLSFAKLDLGTIDLKTNKFHRADDVEVSHAKKQRGECAALVHTATNAAGDTTSPATRSLNDPTI